jgi:hypothetical protein
MIIKVIRTKVMNNCRVGKKGKKFFLSLLLKWFNLLQLQQLVCEFVFACEIVVGPEEKEEREREREREREKGKEMFAKLLPSYSFLAKYMTMIT